MNTQISPRHSLIIFVIVFVTLAVVWIGLRAFLRYIPPGLQPQTSPTCLLEMEGVVLNGIGENGRDWTLRASRADISQDRSIAKVYGIRDCILFGKGKSIATLQADNAVCNLWNRKLSVLGNIRVSNKSGQRMETSSLTWEPGTSILESAGKVLYHSRTGDAVADKLSLNLQTKELTLINPRIALWVGDIENLQ